MLIITDSGDVSAEQGLQEAAEPTKKVEPASSGILMLSGPARLMQKQMLAFQHRLDAFMLKIGVAYTLSELCNACIIKGMTPPSVYLPLGKAEI